MFVLRQNNSVKIQEKLENKILKGLSCEWFEALWVLTSEHKRMFKIPSFSLQDMKNCLGLWNFNKREICLSRDFVLNHPWDAVCDVLRHEMAHQFADEIFYAHHYNESPHGVSFKQACILLRANPKASGTYKTLHEYIMEETVSKEDKIILKIKKLMALSESKNSHEAQAAMAKAHKLIAKYNIDLIEKNEKREYVSIFIGKPTLRQRRDQYSLSNLLFNYYFVKGLWMTAYVLEKNKIGRVLEISGTKRNVLMASYVHDFVQNYINVKWSIYNKDRKLTWHKKVDFSVGIIDGFATKLKNQELSDKTYNNNTGYNIIKIEDTQLEQYYKYKYPRISTSSCTKKNYDARIFNDGIKLGKKMIISKGITSNGGNTGILIE